MIAHTRWATHGGVTEANAHPILDDTRSVAVIHNGVIENFQQLRSELEREGISFHTETDTEVISNLIAVLYKGDLLQAVQEVVPLIKGAWAIAVIHKDHPDECILAKNSSPLVIGIGVGETFAASEANALLHHTREVVYLNEGEVARIRPQRASSCSMRPAFPSQSRQSSSSTAPRRCQRGSLSTSPSRRSTTSPSPSETPCWQVLSRSMGRRRSMTSPSTAADLLAVKRIVIVACGTSFHAGLIASYMLEEIARIPTSVEISSEFRYRNPIVEEGTLVLAISQSGETADTLAAVRELKAKGATVIAICNVQGSTLTREADSTLFLRAGPEIGVCSTKAFTSQLTVLTLFTLMMARLRHMGKAEGQEFFTALERIPEQVKEVLALAPHIEKLAEKYAAMQ